MIDAREKEASLLPGKMIERTLIEPCAAMSEVEVMYSLRKIGARVSCSARENAVDTAPPTTGRVTVLPPKKV
jgi:hypothetical protein